MPVPDPVPTEAAACTCAALRRAARAVTQQVDEALKPIGLTSTQFTILAALAQRGGMAMSRLAEVLTTERTTLTRNLKPLEDRALVRVSQGRDRRVRQVAIRNRGRFILAEAMPLWRAVQVRLVDALGADRWARLLDDLGAVEGTHRR